MRRGSVMCKHPTVRVAAAVAAAFITAAALVGTSAGAAVSSSSRYTIRATLSTRQEVPAPKDAVHGKGLLTGKLTLAGKKSKLVWKLTFSRLSGRARTAEIGMGARGKRGATVLSLCTRKCISPVRGVYEGTYVANKQFVRALLQGRMYVTVTTKLNPKGEIRGQIKATAA
jgi:hypothetical protein